MGSHSRGKVLLNKSSMATFNSVEQHSTNPMKALLSLLVAASVYSIAVPASAVPPPFATNAAVQPYPGERRIISYLTNGTPVYAVYQIVGYDAMGYPIYQWVTQPVSYGYVRPYYGYNRSHHYYGYGSYNYRPGYLRPTIVNPHYVVPHPSFGGHVGHGGGPVYHGGGGHINHGGGGHVSHGGGHMGGHGGGGHHR